MSYRTNAVMVHLDRSTSTQQEKTLHVQQKLYSLEQGIHSIPITRYNPTLKQGISLNPL